MEDQDTKAPRPFSAWLQELRRGGAHAEVSKALAEVTAAVNEHQKSGELTLKFKIRPNGDGAVMVSDGIVAKAPEGDRPESMFFADEDGNLSRRDPRQAELPTDADELEGQRERKVV
jgi:hypothetical protein